MKTPIPALMLAAVLNVPAADPPAEIQQRRDPSTNNVPRPFDTNRFTPPMTNRFRTNDPAFTNRFGTNLPPATNRFRTNAPGPIAPRDRNFPPDTFPPNHFPPDRFPPDRFPPDRFEPDRFPSERILPEKQPVVPPELEPPVRPSIPPPPQGKPLPPKSLTIIPSAPGATPVTVSVRSTKK